MEARLYILPQYNGNSTQSDRHKLRKAYFCNICPCTKDIVYARFEDFIALLYVFINVVKVKVYQSPSFFLRRIAKRSLMS